MLFGCAGNQRGAGIFAAPPVRAEDPFLPRIDNARQLFDDGLFDQARTAIDALITDGAAHPLIPLLRAKLAQQDEDWPTMVEWSRRAVLADPGWTEPRVLLATACMEVHRFVEADATFADIDRMAPTNAWGPYGRSWVAARQQDMNRAIDLMDEGLRREPEFLPGLLLRAHLARWAGDKPREEFCLRRAAALGDPDPQQLARLGDLADEAGRQLDAARLYERSWALKHSRQIARRRLELARRANDAVAERLWSSRAGVP
ncbi:MAG: hypothetical protein AAB263_14375 [Planctomycetota bacterium]